MTTTLPALPLELFDRITDEVYNASDNSKEDLYNLSLTSREVGKRATALIFRVVKLKGASESALDKRISELHVLFESNGNLAISTRILVIGNPEEPTSISSPNFLPVLQMMRNLNAIKLAGNVEYSEPPPPRRRGRGRQAWQAQPEPVPIFTAFANPANLTDIRLYNMSMKYREFENILRSSPALTALLISNLNIDDFREFSQSRSYRHYIVIEPEAAAREDPKSSYHSLQPKTALNLPVERLIMRLSSVSDYRIMDLLVSSRLPLLLLGRLKNLAISHARGSLNKAISDRTAAFLDSPLAQSVSRLHLGEHGEGEYRPGSNAHRKLDTVHLPLCEALELCFTLVDWDWQALSLNKIWFAEMLETIFPAQLPVKKLLLVFDFRFLHDHTVNDTPAPGDDWVRLDSALCAHNFDLEEIGVHIIFSLDVPDNEPDFGNPYEVSNHVEEAEAEESNGSESGAEESGDDRRIPSEASDEESDEESDPDDTTYITDQSEYTDAEDDEEDEGDAELGKKDVRDEDGKGQDYKKEVHVGPGHMLLRHWLFEFALPKANARYHFQEQIIGSSASVDRVKTWVRFSERTSEIEPIFDIDEDLRK
ncbi:hypothetical protein ARMGADRAFT_1165583 [Armillaria gallica]|uniref:Uncharacterized protein n=1 Tax=Armillaria gallica TaxID=47427 RepID=A0A2H3DTL2_ARMGA|nr:hypothetical protein ARMGADRAFT_1165583 [Armillaria gallica]